MAGAFLSCAALWSFVVPPFESPDETGHSRYVNFIMEHGRLPRPGEEARGEAHQPPLYYLLCAGLASAAGLSAIPAEPERNRSFRWYGGDEQPKYLHAASESPPLAGSARTLHWLRLMSVIMAAGTVVLVFRMGGNAGLSDDLTILAASFAAFLPQFTFISASLNNDNLANLLSTACLALLVSGLARPARMATWVAAGSLAGAGLMAKFTGLAMIPCGLVALALARATPGSRPIRGSIAFFVPALAIPAPIVLRNLAQWGDPLGLAAQTQTLPTLVDRKALVSSYFLTEFPLVLFKSFWGTFGWMSFPMPWPLFAGAAIAALAAAAGLLLMRRDLATRRLHLLLGAAIAIQLAQVVIYNLTFTQAQGRFLFPVIGPIALMIGSGLAETTRRAGLTLPRGRAVWLLVAAMAGANLGILLGIVAPAY